MRYSNVSSSSVTFQALTKNDFSIFLKEWLFSAFPTLMKLKVIFIQKEFRLKIFCAKHCNKKKLLCDSLLNKNNSFCNLMSNYLPSHSMWNKKKLTRSRDRCNLILSPEGPLRESGEAPLPTDRFQLPCRSNRTELRRREAAAAVAACTAAPTAALGIKSTDGVRKKRGWISPGSSSLSLSGSTDFTVFPFSGSAAMTTFFQLYTAPNKTLQLIRKIFPALRIQS